MTIWNKILTAFRSIYDGPPGSVRQLARLAKLRDAVEAVEDPFCSLTCELSRADLVLIGTLIQLYSYADFNSRRIVEALTHASTGKPRAASQLNDTDVISSLDRLARKHLPDGNLKDGILRAAGTLKMHRDHRHDFAHWATRRAIGVDAFVMFTMNARSAKHRTGVPLGAQSSRFSVVSVRGLRREARKLEDHANCLALAAAHIDTHIVELREKIEARANATMGQEGPK